MARIEEVNQKVGVLAGFSHTPEGRVRITPYLMDWKGERHRVATMGLYHPESRGTKRVHIVGFASETMGFKMEFDAETAEWTLVEVDYGD